MTSESSEPERSFFRAIDIADEYALDEDKQRAVYATCVYVNGDGDEHN